MKKISILSIITLAFGVIFTLTSPVSAVDLSDPCKAGIIKSSDVQCPDTDTKVIDNKVGDFVGYALIAIGAIAVIFLIIGGLSFVTSGGDPEKVKKAKRTVLYSLIGLALAISANIIVSLVTNTAEELTKPIGANTSQISK